MKRVYGKPGLSLACMLMALVEVCHAQGLYRPATPTISPWMGLFQRNIGPLDKYNNFVRPQMELQNYLQRQNTAIQEQSRDLRAFGQTLSEVEQSGSMRPTGTGSVFMDYSHYYSRTPGKGVTRPRSPVPRPAMTLGRGATLPSMRGLSGF